MLTLNSESNLRILSYPGLAFLSSLPAHVAGCQAAALDPRGRYESIFYGVRQHSLISLTSQIPRFWRQRLHCQSVRPF